MRRWPSIRVSSSLSEPSVERQQGLQRAKGCSGHLRGLDYVGTLHEDIAGG